jgi:hypothetical protein
VVVFQKLKIRRNGMKFTNNYNLPREIVEIITKDNYDYAGSEWGISVTALIDSPKIRQLKRLHGSEIIEDVSDRLWAFFGTMTHKVFEGISKQDRMIEVRIKEKIGDWELVGKPDLYDTETETLKDYKTTSVWSYVFKGENKSYEQQLNVYAYLLRGQLFKPKHLVNDLILRDWRRNEYLKSPETYPPIGYVQMPQRMWTDKECETFIGERLSLHAIANKVESPDSLECTPEERWAKKETYAVYGFTKAGVKKERATRVLDTEAEAQEYCARTPEEKTVIEKREGADTRCTDYCSVCTWCNYWKEKYNNKESAI